MEQYVNKFPILKDTVRIKKFPAFCWIIELLSDCNRAIAPIEAFFLTNCTGEWCLKELVYLLQSTYYLHTQTAEDISYKLLQELQSCITWSDEPHKTEIGYKPSDFIYRTTPGVLSSQERCDTPCELLLSLTNSCNFRCIYCFNASGEKKCEEIETEKWLRLIQQAGEAGVLKCTLTGGEPMLYKGFYKILEEMVRFRIMPYICTNGSLIDDEAVRKLQALQIRAMQISIDSAIPDIHHKLTATTDSFQKIIHGIERLTAAGITVHVKTVLTPYNLDNINQLIALCNRIGVKKLTLDRFDVSACGRGGTELLISEQQMDKLKSSISKDPQIAGHMTVVASTGTKRWRNEADIIHCGAFRRSMVVLPNGDVSVCEKLMHVPEMTVGNIGKSSLRDIWMSPKITDILYPPKDRLDNACQCCEHLETCGTGCFAIKYFLNRSPYNADPRCWKSEQSNNPYANL
ncbi:MAG: radical SAM protein [Lachnospiraceae bacterium]|nr:radical SAM protein [Lachnospiraceae bacterium]